MSLLPQSEGPATGLLTLKSGARKNWTIYENTTGVSPILHARTKTFIDLCPWTQRKNGITQKNYRETNPQRKVTRRGPGLRLHLPSSRNWLSRRARRFFLRHRDR